MVKYVRTKNFSTKHQKERIKIRKTKYYSLKLIISQKRTNIS